MAQLPLSLDQRKRLLRVLVARVGITVLQRQAVLDDAGLSAFSASLVFDTDSTIFATQLVRVLQEHGSLAETEQPALVSLLRWLRETVGGHEEDAAFVDELLLPYQQVRDREAYRDFPDAHDNLANQPRSETRKGEPPPGKQKQVQRPTPQQQTLLDVMLDPRRPPPERAEAGRKLAELGDPRPGVGLRSDGLPDIAWVRLEGGRFPIGGDQEAYASLSAREVEVGTFWMAAYPVTNWQWDAFVRAADGYQNAEWWEGLGEGKGIPYTPQWNYGNHPRETVDWYEAVAFCRWLTGKLGYEVRLPRDEEWERAARGVEARAYPWGDQYVSGYANVDETRAGDGQYSLQQTSAVGIYPQGATPEGIHDLAGNVSEWTDALRDPEQAGWGQLRALRDGSWTGDPRDARSACRFGGSPGIRLGNVGFRVAASGPIVDSLSSDTDAGF